ncbi:MAG: enoyl-CoA hydratase/isomerase family protein [Silvanigrellales bacterium]|nr:enoyl-CoA hydratase/isomerase family protein [Silvanigrellales bacterium]
MLKGSHAQLLCEGLSLVRVSQVVFLVFHAPTSRNAIGSEKAAALADLVRSDAFAALLAENNVGAFALVSSVPNVFLSGGDIRELAQEREPHAQTLTANMRAFCAALPHLSVPTFSLLAGNAYGGGAEVALATDFRMAATFHHTTSNVALHFWQAKWAVPGGWHGMARLSTLCPALDARRVSLLFAAARSIGFSDLVRLGLCDFLPPTPNADGEVPHSPGALDSVTFGTETSAFTLPAWAWGSLHAFAEGFVACPAKLRADFLRREEFVSEVDGEAGGDAAFFERHWMQDDHRARLAAFAARKSGEFK